MGENNKQLTILVNYVAAFLLVLTLVCCQSFRLTRSDWQDRVDEVATMHCVFHLQVSNLFRSLVIFIDVSSGEQTAETHVKHLLTVPLKLLRMCSAPCALPMLSLSYVMALQ